MGFDTLLVILLAWTVAGFLVAIAFGKMVKQTSPDQEDVLASSGATVKYFRKNKRSPRNTPVAKPKSRQADIKRLSI